MTNKYAVGQSVTANGNPQGRILAVHSYGYEVRLWDGLRHVGDVIVSEQDLILDNGTEQEKADVIAERKRTWPKVECPVCSGEGGHHWSDCPLRDEPTPEEEAAFAAAPEITVHRQLDGFYWRVHKGNVTFGPLYNTAATEEEARSQAERFVRDELEGAHEIL